MIWVWVKFMTLLEVKGRVTIKTDSTFPGGPRKVFAIKMKKDGIERHSDGNRQRIEWKGDNSKDWQGKKGHTYIYTYWMKVDKDIKTYDDQFYHLMQLKEVTNAGKSNRHPIFTINIKGDRIEFNGAGKERDMGSLSNIKGKWVQILIRVKYTNSSRNGYVDLQIRDKDSNLIMSNRDNFNTWPRSDINNVRFKFGQYRGAKRGTGKYKSSTTVKWADLKSYKCS